MISLQSWGMIALGVALLTASAAAKVQSVRLEHVQNKLAEVQAEYETFVAAAKIAGDKQTEEARLKDKENQLRWEKANEEWKKTHAADIATIVRLRKSATDPSSRPLPQAPTGSSRPDLICFDRVEYQREDGKALGNLFAGARSLADEGTAATIDLNIAKKWAQGLKMTMELTHATN
jgi:hypothetical protein